MRAQGARGDGVAVRGPRRAPRSRTSIDLDVVVDCSSGTYIRALARDLGAALGVGGHLTALRRTRIGPFDVADAASVDDLAEAAARRARRRRDRRARPPRRDRRRGARPAPRQAARRRRARARRPIPTAAVDPDGALVGIVERRGDDVKSVMNMPEEARPMILWFTYVEVIVAVAAGLLCIVAGLAGRRPSDLTVGSLALRRAAAPRPDRHRDRRAVRGQPADREPPGVLGVPRLGGAAARRRGARGRCSSAAGGAPSSWASPRSRSRSWCGGCRSIWTIQVA